MMFVIKSNNFVTVNHMFKQKKSTRYINGLITTDDSMKRIQKKHIALLTYKMLDEIGAIDEHWKHQNEMDGGQSLKLLLEAISA